MNTTRSYSYTLYCVQPMSAVSSTITDTLRLDLNLLNLPSDDYTLKLFGSSTWKVGRSFEANSDEKTIAIRWVAGEAHKAVTVPIRYFANEMPSLMHAWLFVDAPVPGIRVKATKLIARGYISYADVKTQRCSTITLTNCAPSRKVIAVASLYNATIKNSPTGIDQYNIINRIEKHGSDIYKAFHANVVDVYNQLEHQLSTRMPEHSAFYYVDTNMRKLPISTFGYCSTIINNSERNAYRLLASLESHISSIHTTPEAMLVDMCTLLTRPLIYINDSAPMPDGADESIDQWMQIGTFPMQSTAGFDCEDGAGLMMSIVFALKHMVVPSDMTASPRLIDLHRFVQLYTPFIALGNLKAGEQEGEYVSHAYVTLLDARWVDCQINSSRPPPVLAKAITLEATSHLSAVWDDKSTKDIDIDDGALAIHFASLRDELYEAFGDKSLLGMCRQYTPLQSNNARKWDNHSGSYGETFVMMTPDHRTIDGEARCIHFIVTDRSRIGSMAERLMMYADGVNLRAVSNQSRSQFESVYMCLLQEQPKNNLPAAIDTPVDVSVAPTHMIVGYMDVPHRIWCEYKNDIIQSVNRMKAYVADTSSPDLNIAACMSVKRIFFYLIES